MTESSHLAALSWRNVSLSLWLLGNDRADHDDDDDVDDIES